MTSVACAACGTSILPTTAARHDGLCMPCFRGQTTPCKVCGARAARTLRGVETDGLCAGCRVEQEKQRPTNIKRFVAATGAVDCALLVRLFELDEQLRRDGLAWIGLNLIDPPARHASDMTPRNAIAFAETGGEDVHFSLVSVNGRVSDASPVVVTVPNAGPTPWDASFVVGDSLHEFLSLGCVRGYGDLEQLAYDWEEVVADYEEAADPGDASTAARLAAFRQELDLRPWPSFGDRLLALQQRKRFLLKFSPLARV